MSQKNKFLKNPKRSKRIIELNHLKAKTFLLKHESYFRMDLPKYFKFNTLLKELDKQLSNTPISDLWDTEPQDIEKINHTILENKDGKYSWRPIQLINPIIYVSLVNKITKEKNWETICSRLKKFRDIPNIHCLSLPTKSLTKNKDKAAQVNLWWKEVEQKSLELALDYSLIYNTDITDCYGSIYTHSIPWAIHGKQTAKDNKREDKLIGNIIDKHLRYLNHGQTNGIPQGSVLMDFIAEILLGYIDHLFHKKIHSAGIKDYQILRFRDDYRVFVNNQLEGDTILKILSEVLADFGMKLHSGKTISSSLVIKDSIKPDKYSWNTKKKRIKNPQKQLLLIHDHALCYPNSGSTVIALHDFHKATQNYKHLPKSLLPSTSIIVDIAYRNPRTLPICAAILSKCFELMPSNKEKIRIHTKITNRFATIPNTGYLDIWLQRASLDFNSNYSYSEPLCKLVSSKTISIWNIDWVSCNKTKRIIEKTRIIDQKIRKSMPKSITVSEVELFNTVLNIHSS